MVFMDRMVLIIMLLVALYIYNDISTASRSVCGRIVSIILVVVDTEAKLWVRQVIFQCWPFWLSRPWSSHGSPLPPVMNVTSHNASHINLSYKPNLGTKQGNIQYQVLD